MPYLTRCLKRVARVVVAATSGLQFRNPLDRRHYWGESEGHFEHFTKWLKAIQAFEPFDYDGDVLYIRSAQFPAVKDDNTVMQYPVAR